MVSFYGSVLDFKSSENNNKYVFTAKYFDGKAVMKGNTESFTVMDINSSCGNGKALMASLKCGKHTESIPSGKLKIDLSGWENLDFILTVLASNAEDVSVSCSLK